MSIVDPATASAIISGLVGTLTAYLNYQVSLKQSEQLGTTEVTTAKTAKPDEATIKQAEAALPMVRDSMKEYGDQREQVALANFESDPEMYGSVIEKVITNIANRQPEFMRQLQMVAQQTNVERRSVNIAGSVYGNVMDQNTGTLTSTYTFGDRTDK